MLCFLIMSRYTDFKDIAVMLENPGKFLQYRLLTFYYSLVSPLYIGGQALLVAGSLVGI